MIEVYNRKYQISYSDRGAFCNCPSLVVLSINIANLFSGGGLRILRGRGCSSEILN